MSLPIDGRVTHEIAATLAQLDHHGSTLHRGVTFLEPPASSASSVTPAPTRTRRPARARRSASAG
jgi:hypothetical protein